MKKQTNKDAMKKLLAKTDVKTGLTKPQQVKDQEAKQK